MCIFIFNFQLINAQSLYSLFSNFDTKLECNLQDDVFTRNYIIDIKQGGFYYTNIFTHEKTIYYRNDTLFIEDNIVSYFKIPMNDTLFVDLNYFFVRGSTASGIPKAPGIFFPCFYNRLKTLIFVDKSRVTIKNMFHLIFRIDFILDETEVLNFVKNSYWMNELRNKKKTIPVVGHFIVNEDYNSTQRGDRALEEKYRLNMDDFFWWRN